MPSSLFAHLFEAAPGVAAQGIQGMTQGQRLRQQEQERREKAIRDEMFRIAALELQKRRQDLAEREADTQARRGHAQDVARLTTTPGVQPLGRTRRDPSSTEHVPAASRGAFDPRRSAGLPGAAMPDRRMISLPDPTGEGAHEFEYTPPGPPPPTVARRGLDASGVPTSVSGTPDQVDDFNLRPEPESRGAAVNLQRFAGGDGFIYTFNPRTGETRVATGPDGQPMRAPVTGGRATEAQNKMRVALPRAQHALEQIEQFLGYDAETDSFAEGRGDVPEESFLGRATPGRYFQSSEIQAYDRAAEAIASAILRVESGAAITDSELESYKRQFVPRPGDKPEVIRQKLHALRMTLAAMRRAAGLDTEETEQPSETADPLESVEFF